MTASASPSSGSASSSAASVWWQIPGVGRGRHPQRVHRERRPARVGGADPVRRRRLAHAAPPRPQRPGRPPGHRLGARSAAACSGSCTSRTACPAPTTCRPCARPAERSASSFSAILMDLLKSAYVVAPLLVLVVCSACSSSPARRCTPSPSASRGLRDKALGRRDTRTEPATDGSRAASVTRRRRPLERGRSRTRWSTDRDEDRARCRSRQPGSTPPSRRGEDTEEVRPPLEPLPVRAEQLGALRRRRLLPSRQQACCKRAARTRRAPGHPTRSSSGSPRCSSSSRSTPRSPATCAAPRSRATRSSSARP